MVTDDDVFCDDGCRAASEDVATNDTCDCGHPSCGR
jgi:hypothetical protein